MIGFHRISVLALSLFLALVVACDDNPTIVNGGPMVLVQGVVIDIDRGNLAQGVKVEIMVDGNLYATSVPTGTDGVFLLEVPVGTSWQPFTDDFDDTTDKWIPFINADYPGVTIDAPRDGLLIHACPSEASFPQDANDLPAGSGGAVSWNVPLQNCTDPTYPQFGVSSWQDADGFIVLIGYESVGQSCGGTAGLSFTLDDPAFTVGYLDGSKIWFTPDRESCFLQPATATSTDGSGLAAAFAGSDLADDVVTLSVTDTDASRGLQYPDYDVPVRYGTLTVVFCGRVDGQAGLHVMDCVCDCGIAPPGVDCP